MRAFSLGMAGGIMWAACMFITTLFAVYCGYGMAFLQLMASLYPYYDVSLAGSVVGAVYGFIDGFVGFYVIGWLYNRF